MAYFSLMVHPEGKQDFGVMTCKKEEKENTRAWGVEGFPYVVRQAMDTSKQVALQNFTYRYLSTDEFYEIVRYFYQRGQVSKIEFEFDDDQQEFFWGLTKILNLNRTRALRGELEEPHIKQGLEVLEEFEKEYEVQVNYIHLLLPCDGKNEEVRLNGAGVITFENEKKVSFQQILELYREMLHLLETTEISYKEVRFEEFEKVAHPLAKESLVVEAFYKQFGETVQRQLDMQEEEWELIKKHLLKVAKAHPNEIYEKKAKQVLKDLNS